MIDIVLGGQWGSEGKGALVKYLADEYNVHIRVGGPNAGHTFWAHGRSFKVRSLPVGWTNPAATLYLGPGAIINAALLDAELREAEVYSPGVRDRVLIHPNAWFVQTEDITAEENRGLGNIGSTMTGSGAARVRRIWRAWPGHRSMARDLDVAGLLGVRVGELPPPVISNALIEGTQGCGLSLTTGDWPHVTSTDVSAAQMVADAGLPVSLVRDVILVLRTYPIRVGGPSGPLPNEITWEELSRRIGRDVVEQTTVTRKVRRVAEFSHEVVARAIQINRPRCIALMFADYLDPGVEGATNPHAVWESEPVASFIRDLESRYGVPVRYVGTGGTTFNIVNLGRIL